jgi:hypothetical protein
MYTRTQWSGLIMAALFIFASACGDRDPSGRQRKWRAAAEPGRLARGLAG